MEPLISSTNTDKKPLSKLSNTGKILVGVTGGIGLGLTIICSSFVAPALRKYCLPYVPATTQQVKNVFQALEKRSGKFLDIGSGDGRIVIAAAQHGFPAHGVELNPWLILFSRFSALRHGLFKDTAFYCKNLWKFPLNPYKNIVIFGVEQMMADLERKILMEATTDTVVVACRFPLPNLEPVQTLGTGVDTVWLYRVR